MPEVRLIDANATADKIVHDVEVHADEIGKGMFTTDRARNRSKTFEGIAQAMAEQWGKEVTP